MDSESSEPQFFITPAHDCSYLPQRQATTIFLDPREAVNPDRYDRLTQLGFRRSGGHLYRPQCQSCNACVPTRVPCITFTPRRRHKRTLAANQDLVIRIEPAGYTDEYFDLYQRYINVRHADGDMYPATRDQYRSFLLSPWANTFFLCCYLNKQLVAVAVTDQQPSGLSAIYTFFDPVLAGRSLGNFCILKQIELCNQFNVQYLYLGYWIRDSAKMRYKTDFRPVELFVKEQWIKLS